MPSAHIFTVNQTTFNIHLNYMFAGTGAGREGDSKPEQKGALADIMGIRPNDYILFYVAGWGFYGFFRAKQTGNNLVFYESPKNQYLNDDLARKTLTYRLFIEPSEYGVYRYGVNEWDALENPENIQDQSVFNMQWSWIFKKLKGGRGCTAIPKEEFQLLKNVVTSNNKKLEKSKCYGFAGGEIHTSDQIYEYQGNISNSPVLSGNLRKVFAEVDLRLFFTANSGLDNILNEVLNPAEHGQITYIANENKCSFGMKSIDLLFLTDQDKCLLIELKNGFNCDDSVIVQISGYARWISSYKPYLKEIIPILIAREPRLYPARKGGKYFKYLSETDYDNDNVSSWFQGKINQIEEAKGKLRDYEIAKLSELQFYQFHTDNENVLQSFSSL